MICRTRKLNKLHSINWFGAVSIIIHLIGVLIISRSVQCQSKNVTPISYTSTNFNSSQNTTHVSTTQKDELRNFESRGELQFSVREQQETKNRVS